MVKVIPTHITDVSDLLKARRGPARDAARDLDRAVHIHQTRAIRIFGMNQIEESIEAIKGLSKEMSNGQRAIFNKVYWALRSMAPVDTGLMKSSINKEDVIAGSQTKFTENRVIYMKRLEYDTGTGGAYSYRVQGPTRTTIQVAKWQDEGAQAGLAGKVTPKWWVDRNSSYYDDSGYSLFRNTRQGWQSDTIDAYLSSKGINDMNRQVLRGFDLRMARVQPKSMQLIQEVK